MKTKRIISICASVIIFAGCSLSGGGNDGGMFRSDDGGKTYFQKAAAEQNKTIGTLDTLSLAADSQNEGVVYLGTKTSGIFKSENGGDIWKQLHVADVTPAKIYGLEVDPSNPATIFATAVIGGRGKIMKSVDNGDSWKEVYSEPTANSLVLSLALNRQNPQAIYAGTDKGQIIFSEDGGQSWRSLLWTEGGKAVYKIEIDSMNPNLVYFLLFESGVLRTTDGGATFKELTRNNNSNNFSLAHGLNKALSIAADPQREGWVYVGDGEGLLRSTDSGESWEVVKTLNNPANVEIRSIAINPGDSNEIIFAAAQNIYKSNDGGMNWMPVQFNTGRSPEVVRYNPLNTAQIFAGMNQR